ncbi:hypothetical protein [Streptomyces coffeae]|uniref:PE-PGRS family protein n=1 Tax=Streptomyces coffeae TaxID=621382 RepID=A0ABS1N9W7_9ACTN|nr:hypothetical protein [Streptomyces coffeae]MBL1096626.1 hypothetical protein [Streptomyces coffeae]
MKAGHGLRALRATVFAAVCVLLAALGHAVMSGTGVPWWAIAVAVLVTGAAAWAVAGRERGPLLVTAATVGAQSALHVGFTLAQELTAGAAGAVSRASVSGASVSGSSMSPSWMSGAGHDHRAVQMAHAHAVDAMDIMPMQGMPMDGVPPHGAMGHGALGMWSAHVLVALVCGMWLSGGEQAAFRLFRLVRTLATRLFAPLLALLLGTSPPPGPARPRAAREGTAQRLRRLLLVHVIATRGPPVRSAVPAR